MNDLGVVIPWFLVGMGCGCVYGGWVGEHRAKMVGEVVRAVLRLGGSASIGEVWREMVPEVTLQRLGNLCDMAVDQGFLVSRRQYPKGITDPSFAVRYLAVNQ